MTRMAHRVDRPNDDIDMAIALGLPLTAACGEQFVPKFRGDEVDQFPPCLTCRPSGKRGQHRTPWGVRFYYPHYVYRCYDAHDRLLYVGCSYNPVARMKQHRADNKAWIYDVARTRLIVWPDRRKALDMERLAIETEHPLHNVAFKKQAS